MQFRLKQPLSTAKVPWLEKAKKVLAHRGLLHLHGARASSSLGLPKGHSSLHGKGRALLQGATPSKVAIAYFRKWSVERKHALPVGDLQAAW